VCGLWEGQVINESPLFVAAGRYHVFLTASGTPVRGEYPLVGMEIDQMFVGDVLTSRHLHRMRAGEYLQETGGNIRLRVFLKNDSTDVSRNEDRNVFIRAVELVPVR
jgi:hypothetical protein